MRFSLSILASLAFATVASAQVGAYRPGNPYMANPSPSPQACASQCSGDAGCRSWNFVSLGESAVCELNSADAAPVPSPQSVTGLPAGKRNASNLVRMPGSAPLRLGTPEVPQKRVERRIVRQPVPQRAQPKAALHTAPVRPAQPRALQGQVSAQPAPRPVMRHPLLGHTLDSAPQARPRALPQTAPRPASLPRIQTASPPPAARTTPAPAPQAAMRPEPAPPPNASPVPSTSPSLAGPASVVQDSLFGSLYDDVSAPAPAQPDALADPDAPVATAQSVPVVPVLESALGAARR